MSYDKCHSITFEGVRKNLFIFYFIFYCTFDRNPFSNRLLSNSSQSKMYFLYLNQFCDNFLSFITFFTNRIFSLENVLAFDTLMLSNDTFRAATIDIQAEKYCLVIV